MTALPASDDEPAAPKSDEEEKIIQRQLQFPDTKVTFFTLFRYSSRTEIVVILISTICALAAGAIIPLPPIIFGRLSRIFVGIENGRSNDPNALHTISYYSLFFVYLAVASLFLWFISTAGFAYTGSRIARQIRSRYMEAVLRQNMAVFDSIGTGHMLAQLGADLNSIQDALSQKLSLTLSAVGTLIATYVVSFALYWKLTFILVWAFIVSLAFLYLGNRVAVRYSGRSIEAQSAGSAIVEEALGSIKSTTALGMSKFIVKNYDLYLGVSEKAGFTLKALMGAMVAITVGVGYLNVALAFWQGSVFLVKGETSFMAVVAITLITKSAAFCVLGVGQNAETFTTAVAAARRVFQMIYRESPIDSMSSNGTTPDLVEGNIEMHGIKHIYPSRPGSVVANNLSILFPAGKTTAVVGPSGSGKSSITKLIMRFYEPIQGRITLDGHDIEEVNIQWLRRQIRLVNQEPCLFDTSILENIEHGFIGTQFSSLSTDEKRKRVEDATKIACAHDFIASLPQGYQTIVGTKGSKLSGGQKQRIAIARALVGQPKILILDEATSALDTTTEASVQAELNASSASRTTIVIAHRLSTVREADNIVVLKTGTVVEQGKHEELIERREEYFHLVNAQRLAVDGGKDRSGDSIKYDVEEKGHITTGMEAVPEKKELEHNNTADREGLPDISNDASYSLFSMAKFVMSLNSKEWHFILIGLLASIIAGLEEPASAVLFGYAVVAISKPLDQHNDIRSAASFWAWMFFLLAMIMILVFTIQGTVFAFCSERLIRRARKLALAQMLRQEMAFFDDKNNSPAALTSFLSTETADLAGVSGATLGMICIAMSTLVSALAVGLAFGWKLGLVCASIIPVLIASGFIGVWATGEFEKRNEQHTRASAACAGEAIAAIQTVASLTMETNILASYNQILSVSEKESLKANLKVSLVLSIARAGVNACMALGFWYGGTLILGYEYSLLQFIIVYSSIITSAYSAGLVFSFTPNIGKAKRSAAGLHKLLERKSSIESDSTEGGSLEKKPQGHIEFRNVSFTYPTRPEHLALRNVSFDIPAGSSIALVGHTGCGKSTIVSLLERFYDPSHGAILLDGNPISSINIAKYRSYIGLVNQQPTMLRGSIRMNLAMCQEDEESISDVEIEEACRKANIYDFVSSLPDGFNTIVGNRGDQLSEGQKQRLALARALLRRPAILLLDEATSAVDTQSESLIQKALELATNDVTTITIAHRLSTVRNADVIYVLDNGEIVESGSHGQLMETRGRYFKLVTTNMNESKSRTANMAIHAAQSQSV